MKAQGLRSERETIIRLDDEGAIADVWTASKVMFRRLRKRGFTPVQENERSATFKVPKRLVSIRRPRTRKEPQA